MVWRLRCYRKMGRLAVIIYFNFASIIQYGTSESKSELQMNMGLETLVGSTSFCCMQHECLHAKEIAKDSSIFPVR